MQILNLIVYIFLILKVYKLEKQVQVLQKDALNDLYKALDIDAEFWEAKEECDEKI